MIWYAAHIVMAVRLKDQKQERIPIWENIVLIEASSTAQAFAKAEEYGIQEAGDEDGSFRWDGQPATWIFAGVRKVTECALMDNRPGDRDEISFVEMELESDEALRDFVTGNKVSVRYHERFRARKGSKDKSPVKVKKKV
jgi:hypothetical protein